MCISVSFAGLCVCAPSCTWKPEKGIRSPEPRATDAVSYSSGCWEWSSILWEKLIHRDGRQLQHGCLLPNQFLLSTLNPDLMLPLFALSVCTTHLCRMLSALMTLCYLLHLFFYLPFATAFLFCFDFGFLAACFINAFRSEGIAIAGHFLDVQHTFVCVCMHKHTCVHTHTHMCTHTLTFSHSTCNFSTGEGDGRLLWTYWPASPA